MTTPTPDPDSAAPDVSPAPTPNSDFGSPAWLLKDIANTPGVLRLLGGRLSFTGRAGVVFDEPLEAVTDITFPWYYFSGGFKARVAGTRRRVSLTRPNGAALPDDSLLGVLEAVSDAGLLGAVGGTVGEGAGAFGSTASSLSDVAAGRRRGKAWRELLARHPG